MPIVAFGLNHRSAPLRVLEQVAVRGDGLAKVLRNLGDAAGIDGAVVVSTCNRTEIVLDAERFHESFDVVRHVLADHSGLAVGEFTPHLLTLYEVEAVEHLFSVVAGLESAVLGEHEILGQVRAAWEAARAEGVVSPPLDLLFRRAVEVGKRVRTETAIGRGTASVGQAAVELAEVRLGSLQGRKVGVVGAGSMGRTVFRALADRGAEIHLVNRSAARAAALVAELGGGEVHAVEALPALAAEVDLIVTASGAPGFLLQAADLFELVKDLLIVDVALPRDVEPAVGHLARVQLLDLDDVRGHAESALGERRAAAEQAREIVADATGNYVGERAARAAGPMIASLRQRLEEVRVAEVERYRNRLAGLTDNEFATVEGLTRGLLAKLLHEPMVVLRETAGTPRGARLAEGAAELFRLEG